MTRKNIMLFIFAVAACLLLAFPVFAAENQLSPEDLLKILPESKNEGGLSRAEFSVMLVQAAGFENVEVRTAPAVDVVQDKWYAGSLAALLDKNILSGYPDKTVRPDQPVTRLEAVVLTARALGLPDQVKAKPVEVTGLADANWGYAPYTWLINQGLLSSGADPEANLSRREGAELLARVFSTDSAALELVEKSRQAQLALKSVVSVSKMNMNIIAREGIKDIPPSPLTFAGSVTSEIIMPGTIHQTIEMSPPVPEVPKMTMEQYLIGGKFYQGIQDPASGGLKWYQMPAGMIDLDGLIKQQTQSIPQELYKYFNYKLLGTTEYKGQEVYKVSFCGRIDDFKDFFTKALPNTLAPMLQEDEGMRPIKSMSYWGIEYIGKEDMISHYSEFTTVINYNDKFQGEVMPLKALEMEMTQEITGINSIDAITLPKEVLEAPVLEIPKREPVADVQEK